MSNMNQIPSDENGLTHGEWINYYGNGQLWYRWNFIHGVRHGLDEEYDSNGRLWYRGYRNRGRRVGYWYWHGEKQYLLCLI